MEKLKSILDELIAPTSNEWSSFAQKLNRKEFAAKTTILREGIIAGDIYFIKSGLLRAYHLQDGKEINTYFACDGQFISIFSSFITQSPSLEYLEAIEDSLVYSLSFEMLSVLYKESPKFEKLGRIIAEKNFLCVIDRTLTMQTKTAKEKYLDFIKKYDKKIVQQVPQLQIASFLGIAPESLSRVRKEISVS